MTKEASRLCFTRWSADLEPATAGGGFVIFHDGLDTADVVRSWYLKAVWPEIFGSVFGRFSAKLGPPTPLKGRGSSCRAGCAIHRPGKPILRPLCGAKNFGQTAFRYPVRFPVSRYGVPNPNNKTRFICLPMGVARTGGAD